MDRDPEIQLLLKVARADPPSAEWPETSRAVSELDLPRGRPLNEAAIRQAEEARAQAVERLGALGVGVREIWPGCRIRGIDPPEPRPYRWRVISPEELDRMIKSPPW